MILSTLQLDSLPSTFAFVFTKVDYTVPAELLKKFDAWIDSWWLRDCEEDARCLGVLMICDV